MSHLDEGVLHAVLDGEIPARDLADIRKHLTDCQECQDRFAEAREFRDEALGMIERLDPAPTATPAPGQPRWRIPLAWAATIVGALGLGYAVGGVQSRSGVGAAIPTEVALAPPPMPTAAAAAPTTTAGERDELRPQREVAEPPRPRIATLPEANRVVSRPDVAADSSPATMPSKGLASRPTPPTPPTLEKVVPAPAATSAEVKDARDERAAASVQSLAKLPQSLADDADRGGAQSRARRQDLLRTDGPVIPNPADQRRRTISAVAAIAALGGSIRLVDGLTPARFEQQGEVVRVVYRTAVGTLVLEQWRAGELLAHELIPPREAPADSVRAWESRVR